MESWASTVRSFRLARRLTQKEAARLLGVSQPTLSRWEAGRQVPDAGTRHRLRRRMEALTGLHQRILVETVRRSPVAQMLVDGELGVLAVSGPLAELLGRDPGELEGAHDPAHHPLGREAAGTLEALRHAGIREGRVAFAEAFDVLESPRAGAIHVRQLWIPAAPELEGGPLFIRTEVGRVDAATWEVVRESGERVRITTRHELEVVPVAEGGAMPRHDPTEA